MEHRFPIKDIAFQAGVSLATVDRVLHLRPGVRPATRARVEAAIGELERQYAQARLVGRRFALDVVMEAPKRFNGAVRAAFEAEMPTVRPAAFSARFHLAERMSHGELAALVAAIRRRGSHGVVLKLPAGPRTSDMAAALIRAGIPVATYVTDLPDTARLGYIGLDNRAAGATAAWLMGRMLTGHRDPAGAVLLTLSSARFLGEDDRARGFREVLAAEFPGLRAVVISEGMGIDRSTHDLTLAALETDREICAVYSIGGGNRAILRAFETQGRMCLAFAAHDLDSENRALLADKRLTFVIHHDLRQDARAACQLFLRHHGLLPRDFAIAPSPIAIATPFDRG
ncbi:LacI family DNA-binding transcriptional regulator [Roseisalinus antarcticus]|uniref:Trehalose repressor n=1 Tax=Roseisalinus antarcticus TaxID=254357 RepID=A0A1Y5S0K3_9RHOB|nr:LacI family DNA-binding transcriptional regulator [Roseisalinus antarcticus]SLN28852.1 trehalose repressor [Roseisalinus antarcticus]